ncbi:MAG: response regulator [Rhizobacter sp.]|nr:response regulator [Rhizobacter sp.]
MQRDLELIDTQDVLYIEDHPTNIHLMQALFKRRPHLELLVAQDGRQARELARRVQPALLLVDLRLPDCHGRELLEELRQQPGWAHIPAVAVTAEHGFQIAGTGFIELWPKPLDLGFVLSRLDHLVQPQAAAPRPELAAAVALQPAP